MSVTLKSLGAVWVHHKVTGARIGLAFAGPRNPKQGVDITFGDNYSIAGGAESADIETLTLLRAPGFQEPAGPMIGVSIVDGVVTVEDL